MIRGKVVFRADASSSIGYGHFIRTLAIADMLKDDFDCLFCVPDSTPYQICELNKVCRYEVLPCSTANEEFLSLLSGEEIVVLDNYFYTEGYRHAIKSKGCKLVCIGPLDTAHYKADAIIRMLSAEKLSFSVEPYTKIYLGFEYAMLRKPFRDSIKDTDSNNDVIISFGGSDPYYLTNKFIRLLLRENFKYGIHVIAGDKVQIDEEFNKSIILHNNLTAEEMASLFEHSGVAILSSSTVCVEALSRGIPVIAGYYVDNQIPMYNYMSGKGMITGVGNLVTFSQPIFPLIDKSASTNFRLDATKIKERYIHIFKDLAND